MTRVKATQSGYYGHKRRKEGEIFSINSEKEFSRIWMVKVDAAGEELPGQTRIIRDGDEFVEVESEGSSEETTEQDGDETPAPKAKAPKAKPAAKPKAPAKTRTADTEVI